MAIKLILTITILNWLPILTIAQNNNKELDQAWIKFTKSLLTLKSYQLNLINFIDSFKLMDSVDMKNSIEKNIEVTKTINSMNKRNANEIDLLTKNNDSSTRYLVNILMQVEHFPQIKSSERYYLLLDDNVEGIYEYEKYLKLYNKLCDANNEKALKFELINNNAPQPEILFD